VIRSLGERYDVSKVLAQIAAHPEVWNTHTMRTEAYQTPHNAVSDIWVRYNDWDNFHGDQAAFNAWHESVWYPVIDKIPAVRALTRTVFKHVKGRELGGVLITKVPPGGEVRPHIDQGWHAGYYEKFAVQLQGNEKQAFCFEDSRLSAEPGELYTFDNSKLHWVTNDSDSDRMTLIICIRK
jgi:aspartyl/asparaginyl beta-hydroxylase